jgi:hypothetical protein
MSFGMFVQSLRDNERAPMSSTAFTRCSGRIARSSAGNHLMCDTGASLDLRR